MKNTRNLESKINIDTIIEVLNSESDDDIKFMCQGIIPQLTKSELQSLSMKLALDGWWQLSHNIGNRTFLWNKLGEMLTNDIGGWPHFKPSKSIIYQIPE